MRKKLITLLLIVIVIAFMPLCIGFWVKTQLENDPIAFLGLPKSSGLIIKVSQYNMSWCKSTADITITVNPDKILPDWANKQNEPTAPSTITLKKVEILHSLVLIDDLGPDNKFKFGRALLLYKQSIPFDTIPNQKPIDVNINTSMLIGMNGEHIWDFTILPFQSNTGTEKVVWDGLSLHAIAINDFHELDMNAEFKPAKIDNTQQHFSLSTGSGKLQVLYNANQFTLDGFFPSVNIEMNGIKNDFVFSGSTLQANFHKDEPSSLWIGAAAIDVPEYSLKGPTPVSIKGYNISLNSELVDSAYNCTIKSKLDNFDMPSLKYDLLPLRYNASYELQNLNAAALKSTYNSLLTMIKNINDPEQLQLSMLGLLGSFNEMVNLGVTQNINLNIGIANDDLNISSHTRLPKNFNLIMTLGTKQMPRDLDQVIKFDISNNLLKKIILLASQQPEIDNNNLGKASLQKIEHQLVDAQNQGYLSLENGRYKSDLIYKNGILTINGKEINP